MTVEKKLTLFLRWHRNLRNKQQRRSKKGKLYFPRWSHVCSQYIYRVLKQEAEALVGVKTHRSV